MPSETQQLNVPVYKAPAAEYNNRLVFLRFKWAEEATHGLDDRGFVWIMFRDMDKIEIETYKDGTTEEYVLPQYVVLWNE